MNEKRRFATSAPKLCSSYSDLKLKDANSDIVDWKPATLAFVFFSFFF